MTGNWSNDQLIAIVVLGFGGPVLGLARGANRAALGAGVASALGLVAALGTLRGHSALMWLPAATLCVVHFALSAAARLRHQSDVRVRLQAAVFASVGPLVAAFLAWGYEPGEPMPAADEAPPVADRWHRPRGGVPMPYSVPTGLTALTDKGTTIQLRRMPSEALSTAVVQEAERWISEDFPEAQKLGPADTSYNCHGFIVTDGHYWIEGPDFEVILNDNGYHPVVHPQVDDVVVYRNAVGEIAHSGIVREVSDAVVLVESKWGTLHRVLHPIAAQPFGRNWNYYRSERPTHQLRDKYSPDSTRHGAG